MPVRNDTPRDTPHLTARRRASRPVRLVRNPAAVGRAAEAAALVVVAAALQRWVAMPRWSRLLGQPGPVPPEWAGRSEPVPTGYGSSVERQVAAAVRRAQRALPFSPTCLAQATAAQIMLRRRGAPGTVVLGLLPPGASASPPAPVALDDSPDRDRPDRDDPSRWGVHAWLMGSAGALTGGAAAEGFTPTNVFRDD